MILERPSCPQCGEAAIGTVEIIPAIALFEGDPRCGAVAWDGETVLCYDGQETEHDAAGTPLVQCDSGHVWASAITD